MNIQPLSGAPVQQSLPVNRAEAVPAAERSARVTPPAAPDYDEYTPEDKSGLEHSGFYQPVQGESGPELRFDAPEGSPSAAPEKPSVRAEQTTTDTGRVDREIESLRAEREKLASRLRSASPSEAEKLQKRLSQLENELRQKDSDSYRRAHAVIK